MQILHAGTGAAVKAAFLAGGPAREAAIVQACIAAWASQDVVIELRSSADALLATITRGGWTLDGSGTPRRATLGAQASYVVTAPGTPAKALFVAGATPIFECSSGVNAGEYPVAGAVAAGVPMTSRAWSLFAPTGLDTIVSGYWTAEPPGAATVAAGAALDLSPNISPAATAKLMAYSPLPDRVDIVDGAIEAMPSALSSTGALRIGPDDFGYRLKFDDTSGADAVGGSSNLIGGSSWYYAFAALGLEWPVPGGTWRDRRGVAQSMTADYAVVVTDTDTVKPVDIDVTWIAQRWAREPRDNWGIIVTGVSGGTTTIGTRQTSQAATLAITYQGGSQTTLTVDADILLASSNRGPTGALSGAMPVSANQRLLLYWDVADSVWTTLPIVSAVLTVTSTGQFGAVSLQAFMTTDPRAPMPAPAAPTNHTYPWVAGVYVGSDPDVLFATRFPGATPNGANPAWCAGLVSLFPGGWQRAYSIGAGHSAYGIELPTGCDSALLMTYPPGANLSNDLVYPMSFCVPFAKASNNWIGRDRAFVSFRVCFGNDSHWSDSGKLAGAFHGKLDIAGAAVGQTAGNGGAPADNSGWSCRSLITPTVHGSMAAGNPVRAIGAYAYHQDQAILYGDHWPAPGAAGILTSGRWYKIDQELVINTPGVADGVYRMWVDDWLVLERTNVRWRPADVSAHLRDPQLPGSQYDLNIAGIWFSPEYGGTGTIPPGEGGHIAVTDFIVRGSQRP